jgi:hypothetical protein
LKVADALLADDAAERGVKLCEAGILTKDFERAIRSREPYGRVEPEAGMYTVPLAAGARDPAPKAQAAA